MLGTRMYVDTNKFEFNECIQKIIDEILSLELNNNKNTTGNDSIYKNKLNTLNLWFTCLITEDKQILLN